MPGTAKAEMSGKSGTRADQWYEQNTQPGKIIFLSFRLHSFHDECPFSAKNEIRVGLLLFLFTRSLPNTSDPSHHLAVLSPHDDTEQHSSTRHCPVPRLP
jgi:hypothetical protein